MPKYEFRVLCSSEDTCRNVMVKMDREKFRVKSVKKSPTSDHIATRGDLKDINEAIGLARNLLTKYRGDIKKVTVVQK